MKKVAQLQTNLEDMLKYHDGDITFTPHWCIPCSDVEQLLAALGLNKILYHCCCDF